MSAASQRADVVIVGGAVVGSAVAYFLARDPDFWGSVMVVERDPTYATASTTLSAASVRQQFSTPVNIQMSQFAVQVLQHPEWWFPLLETVPDFGSWRADTCSSPPRPGCPRCGPTTPSSASCRSRSRSCPRTSCRIGSSG